MSDRDRKHREPSPLDDLPTAKRPKTNDEPFSSADYGLETSLSASDIASIGDITPSVARTAYDVIRATKIGPTILPQIGTCPLLESIASNVDSDRLNLYDEEAEPDLRKQVL
jgi:hypothetical protein